MSFLIISIKYRSKYLIIRELSPLTWIGINKTENKDEFKNQKLWLGTLIKEWIVSSFFVLHFCRVGVIFWCYLLPTYESILLILW